MIAWIKSICLFALVFCSASPSSAASLRTEVLETYLDGINDRQTIIQTAQSRVHLDGGATIADVSGELDSTAAVDAKGTVDATEAVASNLTGPPAFYRDGEKLVYDMSWLHTNSFSDGELRWPQFGTFDDSDIWHNSNHQERDRTLRARIEVSRGTQDLGDMRVWPALHSGTRKLTGLTANPVIYIISLRGALPRRQRMAALIRSLNIEADWRWFPAVDGRQIPDQLTWANQTQTPPNFYRKNRDADRGKYGCYLSHQLIFESVMREGSGRDVFVMEDDNVLHPNFVQRFNAFADAMPPDWDIALLSSNVMVHVPFYETKDYIRTTYSWGANAYIVRSGTVPRLLNFIQTNRRPVPYDVLLGQLNVLKLPHHPFVTILPQHKLSESGGTHVHSTEAIHGVPAYRHYVALPKDTWDRPYKRIYCKVTDSRRFCSPQVENAWQQMLLGK